MNIITAIFGKNDTDYNSLSRKEYYNRKIFPKNISLFDQIWHLEGPSIHVNSPIVFRDLCFGDSPDTVSKKLGKPRYTVEGHSVSSLIFFYKESIRGHRVVMQIHFLEEEFFCATYTFCYESPMERTRIKEMLFEKYANSGGDVADRSTHIIDGENNSVSLVDDVDLNIVYLWGNERMRNMISSNIRSNYFEEETMKQKIKRELYRKL